MVSSGSGTQLTCAAGLGAPHEDGSPVIDTLFLTATAVRLSWIGKGCHKKLTRLPAHGPRDRDLPSTPCFGLDRGSSGVMFSSDTRPSSARRGAASRISRRCGRTSSIGPYLVPKEISWK